MSTVRPAAVAGLFYPGNPMELARDVLGMLEQTRDAPLAPGFPKALIVPHAGYIYSGQVAAHAFALLRPAAGIVKRVVLLGPCHRVAVRGLALPGAAAFETPLGSIPIDEEAVRAIADLPQVVNFPATHAREHSLEVQLPFLQQVLREFKLLPLVVGSASAEEVAQAVDRLWGGPETLFVISSDLSHYRSYEAAREIDGRTLLGLARSAVGEALGNGSVAVPDEPWLKETRATFVTLSQDGKLRGCIGSLQPTRALGEDVVANAANAALADRRFSPLKPDELSAIEMEVSLLSAPTLVQFADANELMAQLRPGTDGVILAADGRRGTYLPQVWEQLPDPVQFLASLQQKAGIPADTRLTRCQVWRYQVRKWKESDLKAH